MARARWLAAECVVGSVGDVPSKPREGAEGEALTDQVGVDRSLSGNCERTVLRSKVCMPFLE